MSLRTCMDGEREARRGSASPTCHATPHVVPKLPGDQLCPGFIEALSTDRSRYLCIPKSKCGCIVRSLSIFPFTPSLKSIVKLMTSGRLRYSKLFISFSLSTLLHFHHFRTSTHLLHIESHRERNASASEQKAASNSVSGATRTNSAVRTPRGHGTQ